MTTSSQNGRPAPVPTAHGPFRDRYRRFVEPSPDGLPPFRVLLAFPALLVILGFILIGTGVNGTSSGAFYDEIYRGSDPALIAGAPEAIRSDEWNVGVVWTIDQVQQGFPARNQTFPGGMDAEIPFALPQTRASVVFEPQLWGYLFLDVGRGTAWKWWIPGLALIGATYLMLVVLMPRRPLVAAAIAVAFFASPFFQWWYQTSTLWPVTWGAITVAALVVAMKDRSAIVRWLWAIPVAYATAVMAFGIYAPFIIPVVFVVLFFAIGLVVQSLRTGVRVRGLVLRLVPILVGGAVAGVVTAVWLESKSKTVAGFLGTVYPGERLTPTGVGTILSFMRTIGSSFSESLKNGGGFLGINSSEASTFFLIGIFLLPVAGWVVVRAARSRLVLPWTTIALAAVLVLFLAFMFVPSWDLVAHILFLDRTTDDRLRIGVGFTSIVLVGCVVRDLDASLAVTPRRVAAITAGLFLASQCVIGAAVQYVSGPAKLWGAAPLWLLFAVLSAVTIYLFARRRVVWATGALVVVTVASSALVNPVYVGVLDLRTTAGSHEVVALNHVNRGAWVGVGSVLVTATLLESGVEAYNGTQGAPSSTMWTNVDPTRRYVSEWDRLAAIRWVPGKGAPHVSNPAPDLIQVTFDACSVFAQQHVKHVLSDDSTLGTQCLRLVKRVQLPHSTFSYYNVVPRP